LVIAHFSQLRFLGTIRIAILIVRKSLDYWTPIGSALRRLFDRVGDEITNRMPRASARWL